MDKIIHFLTENLYRYMIPVCLFCVYRIIVCFLELGRIKTLREKRGAFHSVRSQYAQIGTFSLALIGGILTCLVPKLWFLFFLVMIALGFVGYKIGRSKGIEMDNIYREIGREMKKMETEELEGRQNRPALSGIDGFVESFTEDMAQDKMTDSSESAAADKAEAAAADPAQNAAGDDAVGAAAVSPEDE